MKYFLLSVFLLVIMGVIWFLGRGSRDESGVLVGLKNNNDKQEISLVEVENKEMIQDSNTMPLEDSKDAVIVKMVKPFLLKLLRQYQEFYGPPRSKNVN